MRSEVLTRWIWHRVVWQVDFGGTRCLNRQIRKVTRLTYVGIRHHHLVSYVHMHRMYRSCFAITMLTRVKETSFSPNVETSNDMRGIEECRENQSWRRWDVCLSHNERDRSLPAVFVKESVSRQWIQETPHGLETYERHPNDSPIFLFEVEIEFQINWLQVNV
jgi:hypothetical protein